MTLCPLCDWLALVVLKGFIVFKSCHVRNRESIPSSKAFRAQKNHPKLKAKALIWEFHLRPKNVAKRNPL